MEEVDMFQAHFVSKYNANCSCLHTVRLFYSNKVTEVYNTQDAVQDVDTIHEANADADCNSDADCESTNVGYSCLPLLKLVNSHEKAYYA